MTTFPTGVFPSYEDAASGNAPFPDIPVLSYNPLIISPPPPIPAADNTPISVDIQFGPINISQPIDASMVERLIEKNTRYQCRRLTSMVNTGGGY